MKCKLLNHHTNKKKFKRFPAYTLIMLYKENNNIVLYLDNNKKKELQN